MRSKLRLVVLISGGGSNLQAIIDRCADGYLNATIGAVISDLPNAYGLQRAARHGIPIRVVDPLQFGGRSMFDEALRSQIERYEPQLIVMAGFMRVLGGAFISHFADKMLNIHPSLLPDFRGLNTHQRAIDAGARQHGASVHFVTRDLDSGPVVLRAAVDVLAKDNAKSLAARVLEVEHIIYPMVIAWCAEHRLFSKQDIIYLDGQVLEEPLSYRPCSILK